jgi:hypothetical protein
VPADRPVEQDAHFIENPPDFATAMTAHACRAWDLLLRT